MCAGLLLMISGKRLQSSESQINRGIIVTAEPLQAKSRVHTAVEGRLDALLFASQTGKTVEDAKLFILDRKRSVLITGCS